MNTAPGWLGSLADAARERVFVVMRRLGDEAESFYRAANRVKVPGDAVQAGGLYFGDVMLAAPLNAFLRALRHGATPDAARESAYDFCAGLVTSHNRRWQHDYAVHAPEISGQARIDEAWRAVLKEQENINAVPQGEEKTTL